jgi:hypothetical protein
MKQSNHKICLQIKNFIIINSFILMKSKFEQMIKKLLFNKTIYLRSNLVKNTRIITNRRLMMTAVLVVVPLYY